jgi:hypothetical protein
MSQITNIGTEINATLRADVTLDGLLARALDSNGNATVYPAIYYTNNMPEVQTGFPHINFFRVSPYTNNESVRTIIYTINCRDQSENGYFVAAEDVAFRVATLFHRQYFGSLSNVKLFSKAEIGTPITETDKIFNVPVTLTVTKLSKEGF